MLAPASRVLGSPATGMRALVLDSELRFEPHHRLAAPEAGEVSLRVLRAGICNTDLELARGYMDFRGVLGHEFVGEVLEDGPYPQGTRVVGEINCVGPDSPSRTAKQRAHDPERTVLGILGRDGCFADRVRLPQENLHVVPAELPLEKAAWIEPLAAACRIVEQVPLESDAKVAVLGDGKLGLLCAMMLVSHGLSPSLIGKHPHKMARIGADELTRYVFEQDRLPASFDLVVECTGSPRGFEVARSLLRPEGCLILKTTCADAVPIEMAGIVVDEIRVQGSRCGPFDRAIELLTTGAVDPTPLIDARYPLEDGLHAFAHARRAGSLKVLLHVQD